MTQEPTLANLTEEWKAVKAQEADASRRRIEIESRIYAIVHKELPEKGTHTLDTGMKIVTGLSEEWDQEQLAEIATGWNAPYPFPFNKVYKPDAKAVAYVRENLPGVYALFRDALTMKPKKPAFSVKE